MTDIWGNPVPHYIYVPTSPLPPPRHVPFPGLSIVVMLYALFAGLYVTGLVSHFPRTGRHDALIAAGTVPTLIIATAWPSVRRIRAIGPVLYVLPGLALAILPFAIDFYLIFGR